MQRLIMVLVQASSEYSTSFLFGYLFHMVALALGSAIPPVRIATDVLQVCIAHPIHS